MRSGVVLVMGAALVACASAQVMERGAVGAPAGMVAPVDAPHGYAVHAAFPLVSGPDRMQGRLELLEDSRIRPAMESAITEAYGDDPCTTKAPVLAPICTMGHAPIRPALLRLVDARGRVVATDTLERPLAAVEVEHLYGTPQRTYFVTVDLSAGIGSYAGPLTRLAEPARASFGWVMADTAPGASRALTLVRTLKSDWQIAPRADHAGVDLLMLRCRPDLSAPDSAPLASAFLLIFDRFTYDGTHWVRRERTEHGFWESEVGNFPPESRFP